MTTSPDGAGWHAALATTIGAVHVARGMPIQDAVKVLPPSATAGRTGPLAVGVADGHGHWQHFRSERGSQMAVAIACARAIEVAADVAALAREEDVLALLGTEVAPVIIERWRDAVIADVADDPVTPAEVRSRAEGNPPPPDDPFLAYGTTLLLTLVSGRWVTFTQIGDGDVLAVTDDGETLTPVPIDPELDGHRTTSMCQDDAIDSFRYAAIDQDTTALCIAMAATDGYGNAQTEDPWQPGVGEDLHALLLEHGAAWIEASLDAWVEECASSKGSSDDTTVALLIGPAAPIARAPEADVAPAELRSVPAPVSDMEILPLKPSAALAYVLGGILVVLLAVAAVLLIANGDKATSNGTPQTPATTTVPPATGAPPTT